jgi:hypothetical protein
MELNGMIERSESMPGAGEAGANLSDLLYGKRVLYLTLKKKWFDMIASGEKREEYREMKPYWHKRLLGKGYDVIHFRNGYDKTAPVMVVELVEINSSLGIIEWGAPPAQPVYILRLGKILAV